MHATDALVHRITAIAAANNGIVAATDMLNAGANRAWIQRQVERGWLVPIHRGIYLVGMAAPTVEGRWTANVRAGGSDAMLLGIAGSVLWEMLPRWRIPTVDDVLVRSTRRDRPGVRFRRLPWITRNDRRRIRNVPVASPAALVASLATELSMHELVHLLDRGEFRDRGIARDCDHILRRGPFLGRERFAQALQHFRGGETGIASGFEFDIDRALTQLGAPPALVNPVLLLPDGEKLRPDRYYVDGRLIVEADGGPHATERQRGIDKGRDARATLAQLETARIRSWIPRAERAAVLEGVARRAQQHVAGPPIIILKRGD